MVLLIPVNGWLAGKVKNLHGPQMKNKDGRVKLMSEILSGIKVLKLYAWEPSFFGPVNKIRDREMVVLRKAAFSYKTLINEGNINRNKTTCNFVDLLLS